MLRDTTPKGKSPICCVPQPATAGRRGNTTRRRRWLRVKRCDGSIGPKTPVAIRAGRGDNGRGYSIERRAGKLKIENCPLEIGNRLARASWVHQTDNRVKVDHEQPKPCYTTQRDHARPQPASLNIWPCGRLAGRLFGEHLANLIAVRGQFAFRLLNFPPPQTVQPAVAERQRAKLGMPRAKLGFRGSLAARRRRSKASECKALRPSGGTRSGRGLISPLRAKHALSCARLGRPRAECRPVLQL